MCVKPAALTTPSPPKTYSRPGTATHPPRALPLPHAAPTYARRPHNPFSAEDFRSPTQRRCTPADCAMHSPPTLQPIPRRRPSSVPAQRHAPPKYFRSPTQPRCTPAGCAMHSPPKILARSPTATRPPRTLPLPHAAPTHARRLCDAFPADLTTPSPQRHAASPSVPLRAQKNGTAQCMCDAECLGRPSLRSVIWVGEPRAVRRRCGALAWRVGLRPQPWALRSRRCGRVLRA